MKKKTLLGGILLLLLVGLLIVVCMQPKRLGSMKHTYSTPTTSTSSISFPGGAGQRIKFSFSSDIKSGTLNLILFDSLGNPVYELDHAKRLQTYFTFPQSGEYTLTAQYTEFIGDFQVIVYETD